MWCGNWERVRRQGDPGVCRAARKLAKTTVRTVLANFAQERIFGTGADH